MPETPRPAATGLLVAGVVLLGLNLRLAVTDVPPLLGDLGYSPTVQTVLTTIPVACFGLGAWSAAALARRIGDERAVGAGIAAVAAGQVLRAAVPATFLAGTAVAALGIAVLNVTLSSLVKRRAGSRAGTLLAAYLATLYLGALAGSVAAVPLAHATGSLHLAVGLAAMPAVLALAVWVPQLRLRTAGQERPAAVPLARNRVAWVVTAFMGLQSLTFYASVSFLPELYRSRGMGASAAGVVDGLLSLGGVVTAVATPALVRRPGWAVPLVWATVVVGTVATVALLAAPVGLAAVVALALGLSQGVTISLALWLIMARAADPAVAGALSGMAQGVGYLVATVGPLSFGLLHDATGGWGLPVAVLSVLTAVTIVPALAACRPRTIDAHGEVLSSRSPLGV